MRVERRLEVDETPQHASVCVSVCLCGVQVSEQVDSLRVLFTDPVDYLVTPRVLASMIAGPILNVLCFCMGTNEQHTLSCWPGWDTLHSSCV